VPDRDRLLVQVLGWPLVWEQTIRAAARRPLVLPTLFHCSSLHHQLPLSHLEIRFRDRRPDDSWYRLASMISSKTSSKKRGGAWPFRLCVSADLPANAIANSSPSGPSSPHSHLFCATLMTAERSSDEVSSKVTAPRLARRGCQREPPASAKACKPGIEAAGRICPQGRENLAVYIELIRLPSFKAVR